MSNLKEEVLEILDRNYAYQDTDSIPSFELMHELSKEGLKPQLQDVIKSLRDLESKGSVEFSPLFFRGVIEGFTVKLTLEGHNRIHYGRASLIR